MCFKQTRSKRKNYYEPKEDDYNEFYEDTTIHEAINRKTVCSLWDKKSIGNKYVVIDTEHCNSEWNKGERRYYCELGLILYDDSDGSISVGYTKIYTNGHFSSPKEAIPNKESLVEFNKYYRDVIMNTDFIVMHHKNADLTLLSKLLMIDKKTLNRRVIDTFSTARYLTKSKKPENYYSLPSLYHNLAGYTFLAESEKDYYYFGMPMGLGESLEILFSEEIKTEFGKPFGSHNPLYDTIQTFLLFRYMRKIQEHVLYGEADFFDTSFPESARVFHIEY